MQMQMKSPFDSWPWYLFSQLTFQGHHPPERPPGAVVQWLEIAGLDPPPLFFASMGSGTQKTTQNSGGSPWSQGPEGLCPPALSCLPATLYGSSICIPFFFLAPNYSHLQC